MDDSEDGRTLSKHDDPFAPREGKTLVWRNVQMVLPSKDRTLLQDVWGEVPKKEITAIMGPSGAGKSSLLNILAGRYRSSNNSDTSNDMAGRSSASGGKAPMIGNGLYIESDIRVDNYSVDPTNIKVRKHIAFVAQDDSLQVTATPREAIFFSAKLRLPRSTTDKQLRSLTNRMLEELGLTGCADTIVGGALIKGISGGERKRTSVGVELVVKPSLVFLDEPTSGLDSFSAVQLCQVLKKVANAGASVLFTIHQPASEIFNSFDHLILLNKGRVMYQGAINDIYDYFEQRDSAIPEHYNPADWIMFVAQSTSLKELNEKGFFAIDERKMGAPYKAESGGDPLRITVSHHGGEIEKEAENVPVGFGTQTSMLFMREFKNLRRDKAALGGRAGITIVMSIIIGIIFFDVGTSDPYVPMNLQSHFGALIMVMMMSIFGCAQASLLAFPAERPVFIREYSTNHYSVISYFISRLAMEGFVTAIQVLFTCVLTYFLVGIQSRFLIFYLTCYALAMSSTAMAVMLGCAVEDPKVAQEMLPLLFVPQLLFAGFFVAPELIPSWLRWARYVCSLTYAVFIVLIEEFHVNPLCECDPCDGLLDYLEVDVDKSWLYAIVLIVIFLVFRLTALVLLYQKATKFF